MDCLRPVMLWVSEFLIGMIGWSQAFTRVDAKNLE
jgi:hypothetical protein